MADTLATAGVKAKDLHALYLTGDASRTPAVATILQARLGIAPTTWGNPKDAVALGAIAWHRHHRAPIPTRKPAASPPPKPTPVNPLEVVRRAMRGEPNDGDDLPGTIWPDLRAALRAGDLLRADALATALLRGTARCVVFDSTATTDRLPATLLRELADAYRAAGESLDGRPWLGKLYGVTTGVPKRYETYLGIRLRAATSP